MRVLFVTSNRIGDTVLSTGILNHIIRHHPDARITLACGPAPARLFDETPNIKRLMIIEKEPRAGHLRKLWRAVVGQRWDLVVDLRASALAYLVWARRRRVYRPVDDGVPRVVQLSQFFGLEEVAPPGLWFGEKQVTAARKMVPPGPVLGIGPTANWGGKQWSARKFAELVARLTGLGSILEDAYIAVFGAQRDRPAAMPLLERIPKARRIDLVGKLDILTAAACLQECNLYIGNDSGLMHLAAAIYTPTLGLFGPSRDDLYAPWGDHCGVVRTEASFAVLSKLPEFHPNRSDSLMDSLSVEAVEAAACDLWRAFQPEEAAPALGAVR